MKLKCGGCGTYVAKEDALRRGIQSFCGVECLLATQRSPRKPPRTVLDPLLRHKVLLRDGGRCRRCGAGSGLHVHHVRYRSEHVPDPHAERNLISLCARCHEAVHADKRTFQPALLHLLKLQYEDGVFVTVETALHLVSPAGGSGPGPL